MRNPFKRDPDPFSPSRFGGGELFRSVRTRDRKHMQHRWQWWLLGGLVVVIVVAGWALWRYGRLTERWGVPCAACEEEEVGKPFNVLLVGSDSRGDLTPEEQDELGALAVEGARADTLIVGHVDPATDRVIMLQFPRDLYVPIAGSDEKRKIAEALLYGRDTLVKTVKNLTGIPINRYIEVNIAGFRDVVNAIGGVDVCVPQTVSFDPQTGFSVTKPGTITFDGDLALRFVRSRNFPTGDFDRIANQQKFLAAALRKVTSVETLLRPQAIFRLLDVAEKNLRTNIGGPFKIKETLDRFRTLDPAHYEAYIAPNFGTDSVTIAPGLVASIVAPDIAKIKLVGEAIANNESPAEADGVPNIDPRLIRVGVYNGVDLFQPYAADAAEALVDATGGPNGVTIAETANAPNFRFEKTLIRYEPQAQEMARLIAAVVPGARLEEHTTRPGIDVAVIVGDDGFETERLVQILPIPIPKPEAQPKVCEQTGETGDPDG